MSGETTYGGFTREELIACVNREIAYRARVYPRLVEAEKMKITESIVEQAKMRAIRDLLERLPATQGSLFPEVSP